MPRLLLLILIMFPFLSTHAQENPDFPLPPLEPITAENADRLVQVGRLGNGVVREMAWSPDGSTLAIATSLGVWVHDADHPDDPPVLLEMDAGASSVAASNTLIAAGSDDGTVHVWDIDTQEQRARLEGHLYYVGSITFSADGSLLASGDNSGIVRLWDMETMGELRTYEGIGYISDIALSPNLEMLAAGNTNYIRVWNVMSGEELLTQTTPSYPEGVGNAPMAFSPDSKSLVFVSSGTMQNLQWVWEAGSGEEAHHGRHDFAVYSMNTETDGIISLENFEGDLFLRNVTTDEYQVLVRGEGYSYAVYSNAREDIAIMNRLGEIKVRHIENGEELFVLQGAQNYPQFVQFGSSGSRLIADNVVWNVNTGEILTHLQGEHLPVSDGAIFNPDGTLIATGGNDGIVRLLDAETGEERTRLFGHIRAVNGVAFSPDGRLIASGSLDRTIQIWDVETALANPDTPALVRLEGHTSGITSVTFNHDGTLLASASYDGTIRLWGIPQEE